MSRRVHHLCEQAASPHQEISSPLSPAAVATGWVQARRSQGPLRGLSPAGAPEDGRAGRPRPASRFWPRGGSAAGTCGRTGTRPEPAATPGWLSEKGLRAAPGLGALCRENTWGAEQGEGKHSPRRPGRPGSSSMGTRREGSGAGPSGQAVGGGRRGWPRSSVAPPPRRGEACPPQARAALGTGGGRSCAAAAGVRRWGRARSGDTELQLSRHSRPPLQVRTESRCGAVAGGCAGAGGPLWRPGAARSPKPSRARPPSLPAAGGEPRQGVFPSGRAWFGGRGARCLRRSGGPGRAWVKGPERRSPALWPPATGTQVWVSRRCGCPAAPERRGAGSRPCPGPRYMRRDADVPGPPAALGASRLPPAGGSAPESGPASRPASPTTESHSPIKTVAALTRNRYPVSCYVLKE